MTLHEHKWVLSRGLEPFAAWCARRHIHPNALTLIGFALTLVGAAAFYLSEPSRIWLLPVASVLILIGSWFDVADGHVARLSGTASPLGDYLDHVTDRFADVALLIGLCFSTWMPVEVGLFAIVGTLLTSYMGTQAQAVGMQRIYGGLMGRADRLMILVFVPPLQLAVEWFAWELPYGLNVPYLVVLWIAVAGNVTALQRFVSGLRQLRSPLRK